MPCRHSAGGHSAPVSTQAWTRAAGLLLRAGRRGAAAPRGPRPADQRVVGRYARRGPRTTGRRSASGSLIWVQISASVLPSHAISSGARCQPGVAGHLPGIEVRRPVADRAAHRLATEAVGAAEHRRLVQAHQVALAGTVAGRMAVGAARAGQHLAELDEERRRPLGLACRSPSRLSGARRARPGCTARRPPELSKPASNPPASSSFLTRSPHVRRSSAHAPD